MITIVTGNIDSLKTTTMIRLHERQGVGDGFVSVKRMDQGLVWEYQAMKLSTKEMALLIVRDVFQPPNFESCYQLGPYLFSKTTIAMIENEIRSMIRKRISPIFLDEIGLVELENAGFSTILKEMIASRLDLYISVRNCFLTRILEMFSISEFTVIDSTGG